MGCIFSRMNDGTLIVMCGDLYHDPCRDCICEAEYLCDYPVGNDKTCDAKLCKNHAHLIAPEIHYCTDHYNEFKKFEENGGVKKYLKNVVPFLRKHREI